MVPGAKTIADLLYAYAANPSLFGDDSGIPESGNNVPDVLDEARYELEWMLKMQDENGGVHHKVTCENFPGYVMPEMETNPLILTPVTTTATADFCAAMAMAYEYYQAFDPDFAKTCLDAATKHGISYRKIPISSIKIPQISPQATTVIILIPMSAIGRPHKCGAAQGRTPTLQR